MRVVYSVVIVPILCVLCCNPQTSVTTSDARDRQESAGRLADQLPVPDWRGNLGGPLCGIYSACSALELVGVSADPKNFVTSRYIGNGGGSSAAELVRLVNDAGGGVHALSRLSSFDLWMTKVPLVANVRVSPSSDRFDHWVVALWNDGGVVLHDGVQKPHKFSIAEFLGNWSGIGIAVTNSQNDPVLPHIWLGRLCLVEIAVLVGILCIRISRYAAWEARREIRPDWRTILGMSVLSTIFAVGGNLVFGDIPHHNAGVRVATASSGVTKYKKGTLSDAEKASNGSHRLLVDARYEEDFKHGTIPGAVNIPVSASQWAIRDFLESLDRRTQIVVFCQSQYCSFDDTVAAQLTDLGFSDVTACSEGWAEFSKLSKESLR